MNWQVLLVFLCFCFFHYSYGQTIYFAIPDGGDNAYCNETYPCSLPVCITKISDGDKVVMKSGLYTNSTLMRVSKKVTIEGTISNITFGLPVLKGPRFLVDQNVGTIIFHSFVVDGGPNSGKYVFFTINALNNNITFSEIETKEGSANWEFRLIEAQNVKRIRFDSCTFHNGVENYDTMLVLVSIEEIYFSKCRFDYPSPNNTVMNIYHTSRVYIAGYFDIIDFQECTFYGVQGGAVKIENIDTLSVNSFVNFESCTFEFCQNYFDEGSGTGDDQGAGIYLDSNDGWAVLYVTNSNFFNNSASSGGAIYANYTYQTIIVNSKFHYNSATDLANGGAGGAIYGVTQSENYIQNCEFFGNVAPVTGGALFLESDTYDQITFSKFRENSVSSSSTVRIGGGLLHYLGAQIYMGDNEVSGNSAIDGGGVAFDGSGSVKLERQTSRSNVAEKFGGGVWFRGGAIEVVGSTFSYDVSNDEGGALLFERSDTVVVKNTQISNSIAVKGGGVVCAEITSCDLSSVVITDGKVSAGGAIYIVSNTDVSILDCTLSNNIASVYGGGIYSYQNSNVTISKSQIINNRGEKGGGGGIMATSTSNLKILDCNLIDNNSTGDSEAAGGGIYVSDTSFVRLINTTLTRNKGSIGGGMYCERVPQLMINGSVFSSCESTGGDGGGIFMNETTTPIIKNSFFTSCRSLVADGGAIFYAGSSWIDKSDETFLIENCEFWNNSVARFGGAVSMSSKSKLKVLECRFIGNSALVAGGGISTYVSHVEILQTFFESNSASEMGGGMVLAKPEEFEVKNVTICDCWFKDNYITEIVNADTGSSFRLMEIQNSIVRNVVVSGDTIDPIIKTKYGKAMEIGVFGNDYVLLDNVTIRGSGGAMRMDFNKEVIIRNSDFSECDVNEMLQKPLPESPLMFVNNFEFKSDSTSASTATYQKGVFITNCQFSDMKGVLGGAIFLTDQNVLSVSRCEFHRNFAEQKGGAIYSEGRMYQTEVVEKKLSSGDVLRLVVKVAGNVVEECLFDSNSAGSYGGGLYVKGLRNLMKVQDSQFVNGSSKHGSDVYGDSSYFVRLENTTFTNSFTTFEEEAELEEVDSSSSSKTTERNQKERGSIKVSLSDFSASNCIFSNIIGGGIVVDGGVADIRSCSFSNLYRGRAISIYETDQYDVSKDVEQMNIRQRVVYDTIITNSTSSSTSPDGGSIYIGFSNEEYKIRNVTISKSQAITNSIDSYGGGLYFEENKKQLIVSNVHVEHSKATFGGGIAYKKTNIQKYGMNETLIDFLSCSSKYVGDNFFKFQEEEEDEDTVDVALQEFQRFGGGGTNPKRMTMLRFYSEIDSSNYFNCSKLGTCNGVSTLNDSDISTMPSIVVYPGEVFVIQLVIQDYFLSVLKYYPKFEATIGSITNNRYQLLSQSYGGGDSTQSFLPQNFFSRNSKTKVFSHNNNNDNHNNNDRRRIIIEEQDPNFDEEENMRKVMIESSLQSASIKIQPIKNEKIVSSGGLSSSSIISTNQMDDAVLLTYNRMQALREDSLDGSLVFNDLLVRQKKIDQQTNNEKLFLVFTSTTLPTDLIIPIEIKKCPMGYYIRQITAGLHKGYQECFECREGDFSIIENAEKCRPCPQNAKCQRDKVNANAGYWTEVFDDGDVQIHYCENGKCAGNNTCDDNYDPISPICGACMNGFSEWNGACLRCKNDSNGLLVFFWVVLTIIFSIVFHVNSQNPDSSIEKIVSFYGQNAVLIVPYIGGLEFLVPIVNVIFSFTIPTPYTADTDPNADQCPFKRNSVEKLIMHSFNPVMYFVIFLVYVIGIVVFGFIVRLCCVYKGYVETPIFTRWRSYISVISEKIKSNIRIIVRVQEEDELEELKDDDDGSSTTTTQEEEDSESSSDDENSNNNDSSNEELEEGGSSSSSINSRSSTSTTSNSSLEEEQEQDEDQKLEESSISSNQEQEQQQTSTIILLEEEHNIPSQQQKSSKKKKKKKSKKKYVPSFYFFKCLGAILDKIIINLLLKSIWEKVVTIISYFTRVTYFRASVFNLLVVTYSLFMENSLRYFSCQTFGGEKLLRSNTDVKCEGAYWYFFPIFVAFIIYVFVFPIAVFCFMVVNSRKVRRSNIYNSDEVTEDLKNPGKSGMFNRLKECLDCKKSAIATKESIDYWIGKVKRRLFTSAEEREARDIEKEQKLLALSKKEREEYDADLKRLSPEKLAKREYRDKLFIQRFGQLFFSYKKRVNVWYETFLLYRRLTLVMFLTVIRIANPFVADFGVITILLLSLTVHVVFWPYRRVSENIIEFCSIISLVLLQSVKSTMDWHDDFEAVFGLVLMLIIFLPTFLLTLVYKFGLDGIIETILSVFFSCCCLPKCYVCRIPMIVVFQNVFGIKLSKARDMSEDEKMKKEKLEMIKKLEKIGESLQKVVEDGIMTDEMKKKERDEMKRMFQEIIEFVNRSYSHLETKDLVTEFRKMIGFDEESTSEEEESPKVEEKKEEKEESSDSEEEEDSDSLESEEELEQQEEDEEEDVKDEEDELRVNVLTIDGYEKM